MRKNTKTILCAAAAVLLAALLTGCGVHLELPDLSNVPLPWQAASEPPATAQAPAETSVPMTAETTAPAPSAHETAEVPALTEPKEDSIIDQAVVFDGGEVIVVAESLVREESGLAFIISLRNERNEPVTWTLKSVTLDGMTIPVNADIALEAGQEMLYRYTVNNLVAAMFVGPGEHSVSIHSAVSDASGNLLEESSSDTMIVSE